MTLKRDKVVWLCVFSCSYSDFCRLPGLIIKVNSYDDFEKSALSFIEPTAPCSYYSHTTDFNINKPDS